MAYNDFTLEALRREFGLLIQEESEGFSRVEPRTIGDLLRGFLREFAPLGVDVGTEKARSEFIIAPILAEVRRQVGNRISLFSGVEFNVDAERGLRGVCDFLFSLSPLQLTIEAPGVAVVEAKNENINRGISQCSAEMVAAQQFNRQQNNSIRTVYGAVTTGSVWRFLRLTESQVSVDRTEYYFSDVERIVGILVSMMNGAAGHNTAPDRSEGGSDT
jgi:hypothetical protein